MAIENNANFGLGRDLRNAVRTAITAAPDWANYRAATLAGRDSGDLKVGEIRAAATALGIDIEAIASGMGLRDLPADIRTARDDDNETENIAPQDATAFEGRDVSAIIREVLTPAEGMVGQKLFDMLTAAVTPLANAATMGPR